MISQHTTYMENRQSFNTDLNYEKGLVETGGESQGLI